MNFSMCLVSLEEESTRKRTPFYTFAGIEKNLLNGKNKYKWWTLCENVGQVWNIFLQQECRSDSDYSWYCCY